MASSARIDELQKKFDENPRRYFAPLANEYRKSGEIDKAIAICREYLPAQPGHMSGHIVYGQALYEARQFEEAKAVFETALSLDPENLIALRHLGDIALIVGDTAAARGWYGRVLEADPRNEEIQAQLKSLDHVGATPPSVATPPAATPVATPAAAPTATPSLGKPPAPKATPSSAPTVVMSAVRTPPVTPEPPRTAEVRLDAVSPNVTGSEKAAAQPPIQALQLESPVAGASQEAPPLDTFSLEGLETTSLAAAAPPPPPAPAAALLDLEIAAPAPAQTAGSVPVPDLDFAEPAATAPVPAPAATPAQSPIADLPMLDLGDVGATEPPAPAPDSGPFVTETMAELYLQQGHREEALRVYRALVEQRPNDPGLRAKVSHLEELSPQRSPVHAAREASSMAAVYAAGPTIREVLSLVARRRPGFRPEAPRQNGAPAADAVAGRAASFAPDAIGTIFGSPRISAEDESAAMALALAYLDLNGSERSPVEAEGREIAGAPARQAATELSLDSVFGTTEPRPPAAPSSFSFDQFFSQRATSQSAPNDASGAGGPNSQNDVAQFTQWLEGLKQR